MLPGRKVGDVGGEGGGQAAESEETTRREPGKGKKWEADRPRQRFIIILTYIYLHSGKDPEDRSPSPRSSRDMQQMRCPFFLLRM